MGEGDTHLRCPHCSSSLILKGTVRQYVLPSRVGTTQVLREVRRTLSKSGRGIVQKCRVTKPTLFYVPYWHLSAHANGYVLGLEPVYKEEEVPIAVDEQDGRSMSVLGPKRKVKRRTGSKAVEKEVQLHGNVNVSAADLEPLGIPSMSSRAQMSLQGIAIQGTGLPEGLEILDTRSELEGVFVDPLVSLSEARAEAETYIDGLTEGYAQGLEQRWKFIALTGRRDCLIFYPLWVVDFYYGSRRYQAVVDGASSRVLRGRFPGSFSEKGMLSALAAAVWGVGLPVVFDLFFASGLDFRGRGLAPNCMIMTVILVLALAYGTYRFVKILDDLAGKGLDRIV
jgi:hypothetical protein